MQPMIVIQNDVGYYKKLIYLNNILVNEYNKRINVNYSKMGQKQFPIGIDNFETLITRGDYFVDKTLLIKDLLDQLGFFLI